jgi:hypothetical protein
MLHLIDLIHDLNDHFNILIQSLRVSKLVANTALDSVET